MYNGTSLTDNQTVFLRWLLNDFNFILHAILSDIITIDDNLTAVASFVCTTYSIAKTP